MESLENKEWSITLKTLLAMIACTGSIMLTTLTTYFNLKADITDVRVSKDSDARLNDLKLRVMDQKIDAMDIRLNELRKEQEENQKK